MIVGLMFPNATCTKPDGVRQTVKSQFESEMAIIVAQTSTEGLKEPIGYGCRQQFGLLAEKMPGVAYCKWWGYSHFENFAQQSFDFGKTGVFRMYKSKDSKFEVQSMFCKRGPSSLPLVVATAIKVGNSVLTIRPTTKNGDWSTYKIFANGKELTSDGDLFGGLWALQADDEACIDVTGYGSIGWKLTPGDMYMWKDNSGGDADGKALCLNSDSEDLSSVTNLFTAEDVASLDSCAGAGSAEGPETASKICGSAPAPPPPPAYVLEEPAQKCSPGYVDGLSETECETAVKSFVAKSMTVPYGGRHTKVSWKSPMRRAGSICMCDQFAFCGMGYHPGRSGRVVCKLAPASLVEASGSGSVDLLSLAKHACSDYDDESTLQEMCMIEYCASTDKAVAAEKASKSMATSTCQKAVYAYQECKPWYRYKLTGKAGAQIGIGGKEFGAKFLGWQECEDACAFNTTCRLVVYNRWTMACYSYSDSSYEDENGQGGRNYDWISSNCHESLAKSWDQRVAAKWHHTTLTTTQPQDGTCSLFCTLFSGASNKTDGRNGTACYQKVDTPPEKGTSIIKIESHESGGKIAGMTFTSSGSFPDKVFYSAPKVESGSVTNPAVTASVEIGEGEWPIQAKIYGTGCDWNGVEIATNKGTFKLFGKDTGDLKTYLVAGCRMIVGFTFSASNCAKPDGLRQDVRPEFEKDVLTSVKRVKVDTDKVIKHKMNYGCHSKNVAEKNPGIKTCYWTGDPHWTQTFAGKKFDLMPQGIHRVAASKDKQFEIQTYNCPWWPGSGRYPTVMMGMAMKSGDMTVEWVSKKLYVNGAEYNKMGTFSRDIMVDGQQEYRQCVNVPWYGSVQWVRNFMTGRLEMDATALDTSTGICNTAREEKVADKDVLFTSASIALLNTQCKVNLADLKTGMKTEDARTVCTKQKMNYDSAKKKCHNFEADPVALDQCILEWCNDDGNREVPGFLQAAFDSSVCADAKLTSQMCHVDYRWNLAPTTEIAINGATGGNKMLGWHECEGFCGTNPACMMVRWQRDINTCWAYSSASKVDKDNKGGSNFNYISATCHQDDEDTLVPSKFPSSDCKMTTPKSGDAPGAPLVAHSMEAYYEDCRCFCLDTWNCSGVIYRESTGDCMILSEKYNRYYAKASWGDDVVVANRECSAEVIRLCAYQYWMLEVTEVNSAQENSWCVAEIVFKDELDNTIDVNLTRNNVFLIDGRPKVASSMFSYNTEALSAFDGDKATSVCPDETYSSDKNGVFKGRNKDDQALSAKLVVDFGSPKRVKSVVITSCANHPGRHPKIWRIKASPDTTSWAELFKSEEETFPVSTDGFSKEFVAKLNCGCLE